MAIYRNEMDLSDISAVEAEVTKLLARPIESLADLEAWLADEEEFGNRFLESMAGSLIDFYCHTDDEECKARHIKVQTEIVPAVTKLQSDLDNKFADCPFTKDLDERRYGVLRTIRLNRVGLFREENLPLIAREQELGAQYSSIIGGLTAEWEGEHQPLPFLSKHLSSTDRTVRERAWRSIRAAYAGVAKELDEIMDGLVKARHQMAVNAGFENYRDYMWVVKNREYPLEQVQQLHESAEHYLAPVAAQMTRDKVADLGISDPRPWDTMAEQVTLHPFDEVPELVDGVARMLNRVDGEFASLLRKMDEQGLLDLASRPGKMRGGFNITLPVSKHSFIFSNAAQVDWDLTTLIHEMGHAYNGFAMIAAGQSLDETVHRSEIAEFFSHGMEALCLDKIDEFYKDKAQQKAAKQNRLARIVDMLGMLSAGDMFQHWMYTHPDHTSKERRDMWRELMTRFGGGVIDWSGLEEDQGLTWLGTEHYFLYPFYLIEYSISMFAVVHLWQRYQSDPEGALAAYKRAAAAGYNLPIRDVYGLADVPLDFSPEAAKAGADYLMEQWKKARE